MGDTIEVSREAFEPIIDLVKLGLFKDEKEALKNLVLDPGSGKGSILRFQDLRNEIDLQNELQ